MEAVGGGASVLTFLTVALGTTKIVYETLSSIKDGPRNVGKAAEAILQVRQILEQVKHLSTRAVDDTLLNYAKRCIDDLNHFADKVWKRLKAFVSEKDLDEISTTISRHCDRLNLQLSIIGSNFTFELRDNFAHSTDAIRNLERAAHNQSNLDLVRHRELQSSITAQSDASTSLFQETRSFMSEGQDEIIDRLNSLQKTLDGMEALSISHSDSKVIQQLLQHTQFKPISEVSQESGVIGEILDDGTHSHGQQSAAYVQSDVVSDSEHRLSESIKRLSQLVHEKEQQFDTFDGNEQDCTSIIEDLSGILDAATQQASTITGQVESYCENCRSSAADLSQTLKQFDKRFAFNKITVNPEDQMISRKRKRSLRIVEQAQSLQEVTLELGVLSVKRRKRVWSCSCDEAECHSCKSQRINTDVGVQKERHTDCTTTVTLISRSSQRPCILVASDFMSRASSSGDISSISYLAINPILPLGSKVFRLVKEGRLQELCEMLQNGEASLRDCDEYGSSLLLYSTQQPQLCKFLLEKGLDVDHVGMIHGEFRITALLNETLDCEMTAIGELDRVNECREILLAAGADPLVAPDPEESNPSFFTYLAMDSHVGALATFARKAISQGSASISDVLNEYQGSTLLHLACRNYNGGTTRDNISAILGLGFDVNAVDYFGWSCLIIFIWSTEPPPPFGDTPGVMMQQHTLVCLLQNGANPNATIDEKITVSSIAYDSWCRLQPCCHGSYHGDLWDSALHICGYDIIKFRAGYPRKARYTIDHTKRCVSMEYTRAHFELLWQGREAQCPYWDDQPWPLPAGVDVNDHLEEETNEKEQSEGCNCDECQESRWVEENLSDQEETEYDDEGGDVDGKDDESHYSAAAEEDTVDEKDAEKQGELTWSLGDQDRASWSQQGDFEVEYPESTEAISAALPTFELDNPWLDHGTQKFRG